MPYNTSTRTWELTDEFGEYGWIVRNTDRDACRALSDDALGKWVDVLIENERESAVSEIEEKARAKSFPLMYYSTGDIIETEEEYIDRESASLESDLADERAVVIRFITEWANEEDEIDRLRDVMTIREIATTYGLNESGVRATCARGDIPARQSGSTWLVLRTDAEARWGNRAKTKQVSTIFINEQHLGDATEEHARHMVKLLTDRGWDVQYGSDNLRDAFEDCDDAAAESDWERDWEACLTIVTAERKD